MITIRLHILTRILGTYAESGPTQFDDFRYYFKVTNYPKM